jgi:Holliday junction DNA helicase RuvB
VAYNPESLKEFIGQADVLAQVAQVMASAKIQGKALPHILLTGPRGTGKTTLAKLIAKDMNQPMVVTVPSALANNEDLFRLFKDNLRKEEPTIFFIDEVHRLGIKIEEDLYLPLENNTFIRQGEYRGGYDMSPFTVLAATTLPGKISEPLRDRFGLTLHMGKYTVDDMKKIIRQVSVKHDIKITATATVDIALRSRFNPRIANNLVDRCNDYAIVNATNGINESVAKAAFVVLNLDDQGLNNTDRKYLLYLYEANRPIGVQSLVPILDLDKETIQGVIEPYLLEIGFINLTTRGRIISQKGMAYVEEISTKNGENMMKKIGG